ncbi:MAG: hypothetical protein OJF49_004112 [Ktedonobacterales bacterium]|jgi:hypothetical protein|nr:MAG: hypothetical protein OJF49_004112 [Ktedonobacterales bacterium]
MTSNAANQQGADAANMAHGAQAASAPVHVPSEQEFRDGDARALYARMRPDQRTAIGDEFLRQFRLSDDAEARKQDRKVDGMLSADEVAALHVYAREHHPEIVEKVWKHPVTQASLRAPGVAAPPMSKEEEEAMQAPVVLTPTETVSVGGAGGYYGGTQMYQEVGAVRSSELLEEPREWDIASSGDNQAQSEVDRAIEEGTHPAPDPMQE